jgi:hypothetical protein
LRIGVGEPGRGRFGFGKGGDVGPGRGPLVEEREGERVWCVVHHREGNVKKKRGGEARR